MAQTSSLTVLAELSGDVPPGLAERAAARGRAEVAEARLAASVLLLRDGSHGTGVETYLLHRHARMPFAPNMVVFPGGRLDPIDGLIGAGTRDASLRACAVRETEEETGVVLAEDQLVSWAHWITPAFEPRRYDTWFYLAALPPGQRASDVSGETDRAQWAAPAEALRAADRGEIGLMPPTRSLLLEASRFDSVEAALAAGRGRLVEVVLPELVESAAGWRFRYPTPTPTPIRTDAAK